MAITAQQLVTRAYLLLNAVESGEDPTADESADGLDALNEMLANWAEDGLSVPYRTQDQKTLTVGQGSYTWGSGGDINSDRPISIHEAWLDDNGTSCPFEIIPISKYSRIVSKTDSSRPTSGWYEYQYPLSLLTLDFVPDDTYTLNLWSLKPFTEFSTLSSESDLPLSYTRAIRYNLAIELSGELQAPLHPSIPKIARESLSKLKARNMSNRAEQMTVDDALVCIGSRGVQVQF